MHPSQIIIPDFDFYARDFHASLIRQNRLAVGLNALAELDRNMQQMVAHERPERQRTAATNQSQSSPKVSLGWCFLFRGRRFNA